MHRAYCAGGLSVEQCRACPAGFFCPTALAVVVPQPCVQTAPGHHCPDGGVAEVGAVCPAGFSCAGGWAQPASCPPGAVSASGAAACANCSQGTYNPNPNQAYCQACAAGKYFLISGDDSDVGVTETATCVLCAPGAYNPTPGAPECLACPSGTFAAGSGGRFCTSCAAGRAQSLQGATSASDCGACPAGTFAASSAQAACQLCPPGTWGNSSGASAASSCSTCDAGRFNAGAGQTSSDACLECPSGYYGPHAGSYSCVACAGGTYSSAPAQTAAASCLDCPAGAYCSAASSTPAPCAPGTWSNATRLAAFSGCQTCPAGFSCAASGGTHSPAPCSAGCYCPAGTSAPLPCPQGRFANASSSAKMVAAGQCAACAAGRFQPLPGQDACLACPMGTLGTQAGASSTLACAACPMGTFGGEEALTACSDCPAGTYGPYTGQTLASDACLQCPADALCPAGSVAATQLCVEPGRWISNGSAADAAEACGPCPAGSFCETPLRKQECPVGHVCPSGTSVPIACPPGTSLAALGATAFPDNCSGCPAGAFASAPGSSGCTPCAAGSYSQRASQWCTPCPSGTVANSSGATRCDALSGSGGSGGSSSGSGGSGGSGGGNGTASLSALGSSVALSTWATAEILAAIEYPQRISTWLDAPSSAYVERATDSGAAQSAQWQWWVLGVALCVVSAAVIGYGFARRHRRVKACMRRLDVLYPLEHHISEGEVRKVKSRALGGLFSVLAVAALLVVLALSLIEYLLLATFAETLSPDALPLPLVGTFAVAVSFAGVSGACNAANLVVAMDRSPFVIAEAWSVGPFAGAAGSCGVQWTCTQCSVSGGFNSEFVMNGTYAPAITYQVTLPALSSFAVDATTVVGEPFVMRGVVMPLEPLATVFRGTADATTVSISATPVTVVEPSLGATAYATTAADSGTGTGSGATHPARTPPTIVGAVAKVTAVTRGSVVDSASFYAANGGAGGVRVVVSVSLSELSRHLERNTKSWLLLLAQVGALIGSVVAIARVAMLGLERWGTGLRKFCSSACRCRFSCCAPSCASYGRHCLACLGAPVGKRGSKASLERADSLAALPPSDPPISPPDSPASPSQSQSELHSASPLSPCASVAMAVR